MSTGTAVNARLASTSSGSVGSTKLLWKNGTRCTALKISSVMQPAMNRRRPGIGGVGWSTGRMASIRGHSTHNGGRGKGILTAVITAGRMRPVFQVPSPITQAEFDSKLNGLSFKKGQTTLFTLNEEVQQWPVRSWPPSVLG